MQSNLSSIHTRILFLNKNKNAAKILLFPCLTAERKCGSISREHHAGVVE